MGVVTERHQDAKDRLEVIPGCHAAHLALDGPECHGAASSRARLAVDDDGVYEILDLLVCERVAAGIAETSNRGVAHAPNIWVWVDDDVAEHILQQPLYGHVGYVATGRLRLLRSHPQRGEDSRSDVDID